MKLLSVLALLPALVLPLAAADKPGAKTKVSSAKTAKVKTAPTAAAATTSGSTAKPPARPTPAPAAAVAASGAVTLDSYMQALTDQLSLTKDEQTDIKTYYQDDGAKLQTILNDPSLSPFEQTRQVDGLRNTRNGTIEALLRDLGRQQAFLKIEADYRVSLTELAADGKLIPATPPPVVPEPTQTPPAEGEKAPAHAS